MSETSSVPVTATEPSPLIQSLLDSAATRLASSEATRAVRERENEFSSMLEATLTGIALDPSGRDLIDETLDGYWSDESRREDALNDSDRLPEVIIGGGLHAAAYAATRVLSGFPAPLVLERDLRAGGTFALTSQPTFYQNNRNRAGSGGLAGDQRANLSYLPGAPLQAANISMAEYQTNADIALVIRLTLAQFARVVPRAEVISVTDADDGLDIDIEDGPILTARRVIDARGLGDPAGKNMANGTTILTFPQFLKRMAGPWPLRGIRQVAVIGGGDSGKCAVESCLGIAPPPRMAIPALDSVDRIDWYAPGLPDTCEEWQTTIRGRYQAIGRYLRPDRLGLRRLTVIDRAVRPVALPGAALIGGRSYDLVILCTGARETTIPGLEAEDFREYGVPGADLVVARQHRQLPVFRIGPHARLPFTDQERADGVADIPANKVSIWRTANKTAALAATLGVPA